MTINDKIDRLKSNLQSMKKAAIAFSGGKDSFFLLKMAVQTLGLENVTAFFVQTDLLGENDKKRVSYFSNLLDFNLSRISLDITCEKKIMGNPIDRCYHCKKKIFSTIKNEAAKMAIENVLDGTTYSDLTEYRPGLQAIEELQIRSPLKEAQITSEEAAALLQKIPGIEDYFLTSSTCLATRFPYDYPLTIDELRNFAGIESDLVSIGIYPVKVRFMPDGIRIETPERNFTKILEKRQEILALGGNLGFKFIALDLAGIRSGCWDPI
jgi:uncharacterized protein